TPYREAPTPARVPAGEDALVPGEVHAIACDVLASRRRDRYVVRLELANETRGLEGFGCPATANGIASELARDLGAPTDPVLLHLAGAAEAGCGGVLLFFGLLLADAAIVITAPVFFLGARSDAGALRFGAAEAALAIAVGDGLVQWILATHDRRSRGVGTRRR